MQTVELKVSMHCYGCAKKVQKHISKMDGMTTDPYPCPLLGLSVCAQNPFILELESWIHGLIWGVTKKMACFWSIYQTY